jgi:hypothetical protein
MLTGNQTQIFALKSILKQWEMKIVKKMQVAQLKTHKQFKAAALGHMKSLFNIDDSFDKLNSRELYNSIVGALTEAKVIENSFLKEAYTKKESLKLQRLGQTIDDIHIV